ncbi:MULTISPECIES: hypothetical protein [unclassified Virgibacillus]|uniref:hypothetical protein n=1 Tax=unclassified Virgibacillus TaxID=2620237 RepID=UPI0024DE9F9C|nr:hypothetical protein [Virgibacillus sp. LDC-1]
MEILLIIIIILVLLFVFMAYLKHRSHGTHLSKKEAEQLHEDYLTHGTQSNEDDPKNV